VLCLSGQDKQWAKGENKPSYLRAISHQALALGESGGDDRRIYLRTRRSGFSKLIEHYRASLMPGDESVLPFGM